MIQALGARVLRDACRQVVGWHKQHMPLRLSVNLSVQQLRATDLLKFVICDRADYEWSRGRVRDEQLDAKCPVLFSPSYQQLPAAQLANWILADRLPVRFQVQLHKVLWGDVPGR